MSFLNNAGDIIVDAVLTDVGRKRLAEGNGSFRVAKFALADDEIDYSLYNAANTSGSAYYDLSLLQTPVFEPSTYSNAGLVSKLFSYVDQNLLYLPILLLNQNLNVSDGLPSVIDTNTNGFDLIASDNFANYISSFVGTSNSLIDARRNITSNIAQTALFSSAGATQIIKRFLRVSQGFNNYSANISLGRLEEPGFSVYVNRLFLQVVDRNLQKSAEPIVSTNVFSRTQASDIYNLSVSLNPTYFGDITTYNDGTQPRLATSLNASNLSQVGKELQFSLRLSDDLASNPSYYFTTYGTLVGTGRTIAGKSISSSDGVYEISTIVRVMGNNYGFSVDIPVKLYYK